MEILVIVIVLGIVAGTFALSISMAASHRRRWAEFARARGLRFHDGGLLGASSIEGQHEGVPVRVTTVSRGSGKSRQTYTLFSAGDGAPYPGGMVVAAEGLTSKLAKLVGIEDVQLGDPTADAALLVRGEDPAAIRAFLGRPEVRSAVLRFVRANPRARIADGLVTFERAGRVTRDLDRHLDGVVSVARVLMGAGAEPVWTADAQDDPLSQDWPTQPHAAGPRVLSEAEEAELDAMLEEDTAIDPFFAPPPAEPPAGPPPEPDEDELETLLPDEAEGELAPAVASTWTPAAEEPAWEDPGEPPPWEPPPVAVGLDATATLPDSETTLPALEAPPAATVADLPPDVFAALQRLGTERLSFTERDAVVAFLGQRTWRFRQQVDEVRWSSGLFLSAELRSGRTTNGPLAGTTVGLSIRHPAARNDELDGLGRGETIEATGRIAEWDDLYRRAVVDASPAGT